MRFRSKIADIAGLGLALMRLRDGRLFAHPGGSFYGSVFVMWVGEGNGSGDGNFLFVPDPRDPLIFTRVSMAETNCANWLPACRLWAQFNREDGHALESHSH